MTRSIPSILLILIATAASSADSPPEWSRPFPAHRIAGNVYYVGTEDLACFLITDAKAGHILINSALADANPMLKAGIEMLGFQVKDIRILLTTQAHFDHVAGFAEIRKWSGGKIYATPADAKILEDGGASDPGGASPFAAVRVDRRLKDGETVTLGGTRLKVLFTPGHTPGSVSYEMGLADGRKFLIANMGTVVMPLVNPKYPGIVADLRASFARQKTWKPDIWVAAHGSQYGLAAKYKKGDFADPAGYAEAIASYEQRFEAAVKTQRAK